MNKHSLHAHKSLVSNAKFNTISLSPHSMILPLENVAVVLSGCLHIISMTLPGSNSVMAKGSPEEGPGVSIPPLRP